MTIKAQAAVEGDVLLDEESICVNEESGMQLVIVHCLLYSCVS